MTHCAKHLLRIGLVPLGTLKGWRLAPLTDLRPDGEAFGKQAWDVGRAVGYRHAGGLKRGDLALRSPEASGDNCPGVAEGLARRGIPAADEGDDRHLGQVLGDERGGIFLVRAADLPQSTSALVCRSFLNSRRHSTKVVPMIGSPPTPMQVDWPKPSRVSRSTTSYVNVPDRDMTPMSLLKDVARHDPDQRLSGRDEPGQFGPMMRIPAVVPTTLSVSWTGTPSVMQTANVIPAS